MLSYHFIQRFQWIITNWYFNFQKVLLCLFSFFSDVRGVTLDLEWNEFHSPEIMYKAGGWRSYKEDRRYCFSATIWERRWFHMHANWSRCNNNFPFHIYCNVDSLYVHRLISLRLDVRSYFRSVSPAWRYRPEKIYLKV